MALLDGAGASVARLIDRFGGSVVLTIPGTEDYDPVEGLTADPSTTQTVKGVVERYSDFLAGQSDTIRPGDQKVTIKAAGVTRVPVPGDTVTVNGVSHEVIRVESIVSGDLVAAYTLQVRG